MSGRPAALVTGASRGIGEEVARRLADEGFDLTISARGTESLETLATELREKCGVAVTVVRADMSKSEDVTALAAAHREAYGRADVLVLNAAMGAMGAFADFPVRKLDLLFTINLRSAYVLSQELLPLLREAGRTTKAGGKIIAVASTTGVVGEPLNSAYGATKAGLITWCETVTTEESVGGVIATAVCPGYVRTAMTEHMPSEVDWDDMLPVEDVAEAIVSVTRLSSRTVIPQLVLTRPGPHLWRA
ncbi:SDR family NAD(P)-dependent oxidoreductase [Nocardia rhizosphaerihabitans]|uniref:3-oxoacyl-[acyl-carrier-protein] reductase MabA n=1 Tax=Nocardia rhizosphaerihabitans TaxID=1691570 RepID=A0ABQ2KE68_9NOCA|nr:SDR family oxidoreductase [Nocardia rhizosphaerihabitans]GGN80607.1 3-ketoacyl-ACP reductase [Nocardia rhizosphaerihabitans]